MKSLISLENRLTFLLTTPMFEDLEPLEIAQIMDIVETRKYDAGDIVFNEGDPGDAWFSLYRGEVEVVKQSDSGPQHIRTLEPPACFGEIAILDGLPRSATVRATKEVLVLRMALEKFKQLVEAENPVACKLTRKMALLLAGELRSNTEALSELLKTNSMENVRQGISSILEEISVKHHCTSLLS